MATKNKKDIVTDLVSNIVDNNTKLVTAAKVRVPITDLINSISVNITVAQLQAEDDSGEPSLVNITNPGLVGVFRYDSADSVTADDGGAGCIVTATNKRYKRVIVAKSIDAHWYGQANYYFSQLSDATTAIKAFTRFVGLEVTIITNGELTTYWFKGGVADGNLVIKTSEPHNIEFTVGDGDALTPPDGTTDYTDPALAGVTILGTWVSGRKIRTVKSPATLPTTDIYAKYIDNGATSKIRLINGTFNDTSDYSIIYK